MTRVTRSLFLLLRFIIGIGILTFLLIRIDFGTLREVTGRVALVPFLLGVMLDSLLLFFPAVVWKILADAQGIRLSLRTIVGLSYLGFFFGMLTPAGISGDAVRIYRLFRGTGRLPEASLSVVLSRIVSFYALLVLATLTAGLGGGLAYEGIIAGLSVLLLLATGGLIMLFVLTDGPLDRWPMPGPAIYALKLLGPMSEALKRYRNDKRALFLAFIVSAAGHLLAVVPVYVFGISLDLNIPFSTFLIFVPVIRLASFLPLSINGLGIREGGFLLLFPQFGVDPAEAIALSLFGHLGSLISGLVGLGLYLTGHPRIGTMRRN